jgi:uncharacterized protein YpmB
MTDVELTTLANQVADALAGNGLGKKISEIRDAVLRLEEKGEARAILVQKHETALFGKDQQDGLTDQVRDLIKMSGVISKVVWIVVGILLTTTVSSLVYIILIHPIP